MSVGKHLKVAHPLIIISEFIQGKSPISVMNAVELLASVHLLFSIIEFILERNHMNVVSVGKPLLQYHG